MTDHRSGKWARELLALRREDGLWGNFHTLSRPVRGAYTTEQALRRLWILGFTAEDAVIRTAVDRMAQCVRGERQIDGYAEKTHDWTLFEKLMLSAWIRIFEPQNPDALAVAREWASAAEAAFAGGAYDRDRDIAAFTALHARKPKSGFETGFGMFYHAVLLRGVLMPETERAFLEYYLQRPDGMYYVYEKPLCVPPAEFASLASSRYLAALEILAEYGSAKEKLRFAADWLQENRDADGRWDFGAKAKDGVYFPLSDAWRTPDQRKTDCTERVTAFLRRIRAE